ncbi:hypothetical protein KM043_008339 [Ampulex compressa]|nr:hypothetical protein KM043_008339 [Ampulex compressa]
MLLKELNPVSSKNTPPSCLLTSSSPSHPHPELHPSPPHDIQIQGDNTSRTLVKTCRPKISSSRAVKRGRTGFVSAKLSTLAFPLLPRCRSRSPKRAHISSALARVKSVSNNPVPGLTGTWLRIALAQTSQDRGVLPIHAGAGSNGT